MSETKGHCHSEQAESSAVTSTSSLMTELIIEGAGCASCVGKIEGALKAVSGVEHAEMNFAQRTVSVQGRQIQKR